MASPKHFLDISAVKADDLRTIIDDALIRKLATKAGTADQAARRQDAGDDLRKAIDAHPRVVRCRHCASSAAKRCFCPAPRCSLARAETIGDTARVLSRYVDAIIIRTTEHSRLLELAEHATVPVINALTDDTHPCQIMADVMTFEEHRGPIKGKTIAWTGDGNNVLHSLVEGLPVSAYRMNMAVPLGSEPKDHYLNWARNEGAEIMLGHDADRAVAGVDCVVTDTWVSMNQEHRARGHNVFQPYQVNAALMGTSR